MGRSTPPKNRTTVSFIITDSCRTASQVHSSPQFCSFSCHNCRVQHRAKGAYPWSYTRLTSQFQSSPKHSFSLYRCCKASCKAFFISFSFTTKCSTIGCDLSSQSFTTNNTVFVTIMGPPLCFSIHLFFFFKITCNCFFGIILRLS